MSPLADQPLHEVLDALASPDAGSAAGVAAAVTCAQAAALVELTATLAARRSRAGDGAAADRMEEIAERAGALRRSSSVAADDDVAAYSAIRGLTGSERAIALTRAAEVPAALARAAVETSALAGEVADHAIGAPWAADVQAARILATAAESVSTGLTQVNLAAAARLANGGMS